MGKDLYAQIDRGLLGIISGVTGIIEGVFKLFTPNDQGSLPARTTNSVRHDVRYTKRRRHAGGKVGTYVVTVYER